MDGTGRSPSPEVRYSTFKVTRVRSPRITPAGVQCGDHLHGQTGAAGLSPGGMFSGDMSRNLGIDSHKGRSSFISKAVLYLSSLQLQRILGFERSRGH